MKITERSGTVAGSGKAEKAFAAWENPSVLLLTTSEAAIILRYTERHIINLIAEGYLDTLPKELGKWRVKKSSVRKHLGLPQMDDESQPGIAGVLLSPDDLLPDRGNSNMHSARLP